MAKALTRYKFLFRKHLMGRLCLVYGVIIRTITMYLNSGSKSHFLRTYPQLDMSTGYPLCTMELGSTVRVHVLQNKSVRFYCYKTESCVVTIW